MGQFTAHPVELLSENRGYSIRAAMKNWLPPLTLDNRVANWPSNICPTSCTTLNRLLGVEVHTPKVVC